MVPMISSKMKIFSIHNGINSSAAYYANGKILEAVSEERFIKVAVGALQEYSANSMASKYSPWYSSRVC